MWGLSNCEVVILADEVAEFDELKAKLILLLLKEKDHWR